MMSSSAGALQTLGVGTLVVLEAQNVTGELVNLVKNAQASQKFKPKSRQYFGKT